LFDPTAAHFIRGAEITRDASCPDSGLVLCGPSFSSDIDGDGIDDVVTVNTCVSPPRLRIYRVHSSGATPAVSCDAMPLPTAAALPTKIELADVDADGAVDAILSFGPMSRGSGPAAMVFWGTPQGMTPFSEMGSNVVLDPSVSPIESVSINADADPTRQIAVLTDSGVFLAKLEVGTRTFATPRLVSGMSSGASRGSIRASDVNQDGLADLVYSDEGSVHVFLAIPHGQEAAP
jgi:hypothetical protein